MTIRTVIDARDALQRRLDAARSEYGRLSSSPATSSRRLATQIRLAKQIGKLEQGIERLNDLAADKAERGKP